MPFMNTGSYQQAGEDERTRLALKRIKGYKDVFLKALNETDDNTRRSAVEQILQQPIEEKKRDGSTLLRISLSQLFPSAVDEESTDMCERKAAAKKVFDVYCSNQPLYLMALLSENITKFSGGRFRECLIGFYNALLGLEKTQQPAQQSVTAELRI